MVWWRFSIAVTTPNSPPPAAFWNSCNICTILDIKGRLDIDLELTTWVSPDCGTKLMFMGLNERDDVYLALLRGQTVPKIQLQGSLRHSDNMTVQGEAPPGMNNSSKIYIYLFNPPEHESEENMSEPGILWFCSCTDKQLLLGPHLPKFRLSIKAALSVVQLHRSWLVGYRWITVKTLFLPRVEYMSAESQGHVWGGCQDPDAGLCSQWWQISGPEILPEGQTCKRSQRDLVVWIILFFINPL